MTYTTMPNDQQARNPWVPRALAVGLGALAFASGTIYSNHGTAVVSSGLPTVRLVRGGDPSKEEYLIIEDLPKKVAELLACAQEHCQSAIDTCKDDDECAANLKKLPTCVDGDWLKPECVAGLITPAGKPLEECIRTNCVTNE